MTPDFYANPNLNAEPLTPKLQHPTPAYTNIPTYT